MTECSLNEIVLFRENETARHMEIGSSRSCLLRTGRILFIFLLFSEIADSVLRLPSSRSATSIFLFFADRLDRSSNFRHRSSPFDPIQQRFVHSPSRYEAASCPRRLSFVSELEQLDPWKCRNLAVSLNSVPYASSTRILHSVSMIRHSFSAFFITRSTTPRRMGKGWIIFPLTGGNFSFSRKTIVFFISYIRLLTRHFSFYDSLSRHDRLFRIEINKRGEMMLWWKIVAIIFKM